jgi:hypothetical protein
MRGGVGVRHGDPRVKPSRDERAWRIIHGACVVVWCPATAGGAPSSGGYDRPQRDSFAPRGGFSGGGSRDRREGDWTCPGYVSLSYSLELFSTHVLSVGS